ncbi:hypothetical protein Hypma_006207 [Hypsizygus marmoreus]|uniref:Uncharacterized protein n=1 Tax=Hypsizygus marmoreus TaxID=39966 RepID=A0A369K059_HYPMA|nr:hypothetical protein Hypma_006207 [Hypsizygus marmoreus]
MVRISDPWRGLDVLLELGSDIFYNRFTDQERLLVVIGVGGDGARIRSQVPVYRFKLLRCRLFAHCSGKNHLTLAPIWTSAPRGTLSWGKKY